MPAAESEPYASSATVTPTGGAEVARDWNRDAAKAVHWYRVRFDAWQQFMQQLGLEPELLVKLYYRANVLEYFDNMLCPLAPSLELLQGLLDNAEMMEIESPTAECFARAWRKEFAAVCPR